MLVLMMIIMVNKRMMMMMSTWKGWWFRKNLTDPTSAKKTRQRRAKNDRCRQSGINSNLRTGLSHTFSSTGSCLLLLMEKAESCFLMLKMSGERRRVGMYGKEEKISVPPSRRYECISLKFKAVQDLSFEVVVFAEMISIVNNSK